MRPWLWLLGGLLLWTGHFLGVYALASLADMAGPEGRRACLVAFWVLTAACLALGVVLTLRAALLSKAGEANDRFMGRIAALGGAVAVVAILFQAAPALHGLN